MIKIIDNAVCFRSGMQIDADGSPRAYAPKSPQFHPLDYLANGGHPGNWYGLVTDNGKPSGNPVVQGAGDPHPGYFVSPTALQDHTKHYSDPTAYLDSENVPYISIPPDLKAQGVHLGDLAIVSVGDSICGCIVGDVGPHGKYGEASIAVANTMEIPSSPKNGGCDSGVVYIIFPGTHLTPPWPRTVQDIQASAELLFSMWNGSLDEI